MTTKATTLPTAPLNLAALVAPLPPVILPNGAEHKLVYTAAVAEVYKRIRRMQAEAERGDPVDDELAEDLIDQCIALAMPSASPDDLASLGVRIEVKLTILAAAAGAVDEVMHALEAMNQSGKATADEGAPLSPPSTTSAQS